MKKTLFHTAFPVRDINKTKAFYIDLLGCTIGRSAGNWVDINFFGHQITAQLNPKHVHSNIGYYNEDRVPVNHFGVILAWNDWHQLKERLIKEKVQFLIKPRTVFQGEVGEQMSMFVKDPNDYAIEFKTFKHLKKVFMR